MDIDPGEGTSDGRVKRKANNIEVEIKQEPDIKEEPSDGNEFGLVTRSNERFGVGVATVTLNIEWVDESESDFDFESDLNGVKEEVMCKETKSGENSSTNSGSNGNEPNAHGGQGDGPMVPNVNRTRLNSNVNGKKDSSRKQNQRKIPRNKAAKKRTENKCHVCGYVTSRKADLTRHIRIHTGDKPNKCEECSKRFTQKGTLVRHKIIHSGEKQFECLVCSKSFARKQHLNVHLRTHFDELPHSCLNCGQRFAQEEAKQSHEKRCKHRRYECYLCGYECFAKYDQNRHMHAKHIGDRQFQCEICGKKFIHKGHLNQHLATHRDQFPFRCIKCRRGLAKGEDKVAHEKICARRQYQCYICKVFKSKTTNLRNHMRMHHTGEKPFHCKWCAKCFIQKHDAEKHMKRIHRSKK